jgi:hypothetical protein
MMKRILHFASLLVLLASTRLLAQPEMRNWYFGDHAAISFASGSPVVVAGSALYSYESSTSTSDASGNLLFYTNAETIWNRNNQPMPNGNNFGGNSSATQATVVVQNPVNAQQYYVFLTPEVAVDNLLGGLRYRIVDMTADNGLGDVGPLVTLFNPSTTRVSERLTAVRHANGRDTWILIHEFPGNTFDAFLMTPTGLSTTPVVSTVGAFQSGGGGNFNTNNSVGYLKASADGSRLAMATRNSRVELFDFNNATGAVSNVIDLGLPGNANCYGLEFSPDGSRLYVSTIAGFSVYQWNLLAGSPAAIASSAVRVASTSNAAGGLAKGPDGRIYLSVLNSPSLAAIPNPNVLGTGCGYLPNAVPLGGRTCVYGISNFTNSYALITNYWTGNVSADYLLPANWNAGYVPLATDDVTIPAAAVRMPVLGGAVTHHAFTIENGASMTLASGGTLTLSSDLTNSGTLQGEGTLATSGSAVQQLNGQPFTLGGLTVGSAGATLGTNLSLTRVLTLNGNLTATGQELTLLSTATGTAMVVNNGMATVTGPATVQRYVGPAQNAGLGYRHVAAPVAGTTVGSLRTTNFVPLTNPAYNTTGNSVTPFPTVYSYSQNRVTTTGGTLADFDLGWQSPAGSGEALDDMAGYTLNMPAGETFSFTGTLHNGPYTRSNLARGTGQQSGWHFLGNPYPSPISWTQAFAGATGLDNAVYVYQSSGQYAGAYASFVNGVSINGGSDEIALGRGFFVRTSAAGTPGRLALTNAARLGSYANPNFQRPAADPRPLLRLALTASTGPADEAVVYVENNATTGFDARYDAFKIMAGQRSLGLALGSDLLAVQALPPLSGTPVVLPLRVLVEGAGTFTIEARELRNFPAGTQLLLHDTETGSLTPLTAQTRYRFTAPAQEQGGRFFLRLYRPTASLAAQALSEAIVYPNPAHDRLWLARPAALAGLAATLTLRNSLGQVVRQQAVAATTADASVSLAGLARGVYTLQVQSTAGSLSRRVVVE